jgi:hypothetical protein
LFFLYQRQETTGILTCHEEQSWGLVLGGHLSHLSSHYVWTQTSLGMRSKSMALSLERRIDAP